MENTYGGRFLAGGLVSDSSGDLATLFIDWEGDVSSTRAVGSDVFGFSHTLVSLFGSNDSANLRGVQKKSNFQADRFPSAPEPCRSDTRTTLPSLRGEEGRGGQGGRRRARGARDDGLRS